VLFSVELLPLDEPVKIGREGATTGLRSQPEGGEVSVWRRKALGWLLRLRWSKDVVRKHEAGVIVLGIRVFIAVSAVFGCLESGWLKTVY
jgi:hypothetical protein